ncbi:MAG: Signal recognition particle 54 kDa protein [Pseudomonadota bacterium]|jgi:flagellar biosynthesis GTPase FlhF
MELKRIIAKDLRAATEMAVAQYGPDTLVISHEMVGGKTEVIVAVDVSPDASTLIEGRPGRTEPRGGFPQSGQAGFDQALTHELHGTEPSDTSDRNAIRAREIVDLVRQEMAALKQELQLANRAQPLMAPMTQNPIARQLDRALEHDHAPLGLRMLLSEELSAVDSMAEALSRLGEILQATIGARAPLSGPLAGFHAIMGPSGSGKTTMITKLANQAAETYGADRVAVISWADNRAGAWQQIQLGCARIGIDCFRSQDPGFLPTLLEEIGHKACVLIDTPGTELSRYRQLLQEISPESALHLVLPADVATHQAERLLRGHPWQSLMLTKLDEAHHVWGTIQALSHVPTVLWERASMGESLTAWQDMSVADLVRFAIDRLSSLATLSPSESEFRRADRMSIPDANPSASAWVMTQQAGRTMDRRYS